MDVQTRSESAASTPLPAYKQTQAWDALRRSWFGALVRELRSYRRELRSWLQPPQIDLPGVHQLTASLADFQADAAGASDEWQYAEVPVFLLSTGWRAGSTLLQRVLVTDPRLLLWGEPLGEMTIVSRMAEMIGRSISPRNLRLWRGQQDPRSPQLSTSWVANLYPPGKDFRWAIRGMLERWLRDPAVERGFSRWGFKEVRFGAPEAVLLHWLYPNAKFVIISRHPYDAYRSLADAQWGEVYDRYPDVCVDSACSFARHWNRLAVSWSQLPAGFPCVHLKYEDLIGGKVNFRTLETWLGIEIKETIALSASVGGTAKRAQLAWHERWIIAREARDGMRALGYSK